jgi:TRAP-type C4-dicarboxylate transport system substrate-binding protein
MEQWCKEVEKRTNGQVKVKYYPGGTVVSVAQTFDSIVSGVVDMGFFVLGYTMGKFPLSDVLAYPLGSPSAVASVRLANEYYAKFKPKEFDEVKVCYLSSSGPGIFHTRKPVNKLEDMKGMKIRTFGPMMKFVADLGAVPVGMPMGEAYDAVSKGVVDGLASPYEALFGWKLGEVVKYSIENMDSSHAGVTMLAMNINKWNSLSADVKKTIDAISAEWIEKEGIVWDDLDNQGRKFAEERGMKVIKLSIEENARWAAKAQPLFDEYIKAMKAKGLPGEEVVKFYREKLKAYRK